LNKSFPDKAINFLLVKVIYFSGNNDFVLCDDHFTRDATFLFSNDLKINNRICQYISKLIRMPM